MTPVTALKRMHLVARICRILSYLVLVGGLGAVWIFAFTTFSNLIDYQSGVFFQAISFGLLLSILPTFFFGLLQATGAFLDYMVTRDIRSESPQYVPGNQVQEIHVGQVARRTTY